MLHHILPELILFATAVALLVAGVFSKQKQSIFELGIPLSGLVLAFFVLFVQPPFSGFSIDIFSKAIIIDPVTQFFKALLMIAGAVAVVMGWISKEIKESEKTEFFVITVLCVFGMCLMTSATHFLLLFLAYQITVFCTTMLTAFNRRSQVSSEAGIKVFIYGALTTVLFVVGIAMIYGVGKSFNLYDIKSVLASRAFAGEEAAYIWIAFGLIFIAIASRMALFPFHFLVPDIAQGSATPVSAFLSVAPFIAATSVLLRLCIQLFSNGAQMRWAPFQGFDWPQLLAGLAATTMTVGNLTALQQRNLKRLLGYSSVAQMGYTMMGLVVATHMGVSSLLFSLAIYGLVTLGSFFVVQVAIDHKKDEDISSLRGIIWKNPLLGVGLGFFLLSLAGLPPLAGFVGRFYILGVVVQEKLYWLSVLYVLNWIIALPFYLSLIWQIFAGSPTAAAQGDLEQVLSGKHTSLVQACLVLLMLPTVALGVYWNPLLEFISRSLLSAVW